MRKIFTLFLAFFCAMSALGATFSFTSAESVTQTVDGYTVTIGKGGGSNAPAYYTNGLRLYAGNTITVSGADLTSIKLTFSMQGTKTYADLSASAGTLVSGGVSTSDKDVKTDDWTGSTSSVTFTLGSSGQRLIYSIVVNGDGSEGGNPGGDDQPSGPTDPDTPSTLDPDFVYPEPTYVMVPSITVQGAEYSFVENNILVNCTKGAVTADYFSAHAGFALSFTATRPIKGIVINGFVKKDFTATADHGKISYLTPGEDTSANPVIVLTDVNSNSVTIDCVKQLRCYNVEIYFESNPEAVIGGSNGSGEEIELVFDSAEAVYESEFVEIMEEENYSIFLFNQAEPDVPYFALDIYPADKDILTGTYSWDNWTLGDYTYYVYGYGDDDFTWAERGEVTISKSGDIYTITGTIICDNSNTYAISFTGKMPIYLDKDYYGDDTGVELTPTDSSESDYDNMYDLNGRRVSKGYRGIYIRDGKKLIGR